jgi:hypothetical protein
MVINIKYIVRNIKKVPVLCVLEKRTLHTGPQLWYHVYNYFINLIFIGNFPSTAINIITKLVQLKELLNKEFRSTILLTTFILLALAAVCWILIKFVMAVRITITHFLRW